MVFRFFLILYRFLCLIVLLAPIYSFAATLPAPQKSFTQPKQLNLQEAVLLALRNNPDIQNAELQRVLDKFALEVAHNQFEPQYSFTMGANYGTGQSPSYSVTPGVSITTPYGTQVNVGTTNSISGGSNNAVGTVSINQPLLKGFGRTVTENDLFQAVQTEKNNKLNFKNSIITAIINVIQAYNQLVQDYNTLQTNELALRQSQSELQHMQFKMSLGRLARTDVVQQQSSVAEQRVSVEQTQNQIQQDYQKLLTVLGLDPSSNLTIDKKIQTISEPLPSLQQAIKIALANNIEYLTALNNYEVTKRNVKVAENSQKWDLELQASASHTLAGGNNGISIPSNSGSSCINPPCPLVPPSTNNGITGSGTTKTLGLTLTIPIDKISLKQQLAQAKIGLQQATISLAQQKRSLISQVTSAYQSLLSQQQQIQLSENSAKLAQQSLNIEIIKYNYGRAAVTDVNNQRNNLTRDLINLINQKIQYANSVQEFYQLLGITLDQWHITLTY